ncbi:methyltransferase family protein [Rhizobium halophytocola]|uniref:Protein-S-isoprenylcysteine O-methyltransferase Ste14 n=1 Tax=Rhizobium halophytocola TaxID=735519 RepID=A0ABS4DZP6_9HYPH|nr:isoprenylcysteine carboxylmethyltransferase family protein [Rhizobium halophytocola]MBP1851165.1 protein-S-isoprenylcysteine O-methyltransferase Ste14 [Rhizobium halophytocola]
MNAYRLKPMAFPWPPMLYTAAIAGAFGLGRLIDLSMPARTQLMVSGFILLALALALMLWSMKSKIDAHVSPFGLRKRPTLMTTGPYRFTRNPIYLGYTLATIAAGLLSANPWFLLGALTAAIVTTQIAIRREEMLLLARYGIDYERYCRQVRRWL